MAQLRRHQVTKAANVRLTVGFSETPFAVMSLACSSNVLMAAEQELSDLLMVYHPVSKHRTDVWGKLLFAFSQKVR